MAIVFTYTKSTNTAVVTGGTSGTPATFADFVTADRAGSVTLLAAWAPNSGTKALTYQITPVEKLALLISFVIATKTAEADYIFITGTDAWDAAQTESIDVTAGNGTYVSTKRFRTITNIDCSDNAAGGGTVWADGTVVVTQPQWGVIWNLGNKQYKISCTVNIGDASTSTYFATTREQIVLPFITTFGNCFVVKANATFRSGIKVSSTQTNGGSQFLIDSVGSAWGGYIFAANTGLVLLYNTSVILTNPHATYGPSIRTYASSQGAEYIDLTVTGLAFYNYGGTVYYYNVLIINPVDIDYPFYWAGSTSAGIERVTIQIPTNYFFFVSADAVDVTVRDLVFQGTPVVADLAIGLRYNGGDIFLVDCVLPNWTIHNADTSSQGGYLYRQYSVNIHLADKDGSNLASATVLCQDKNGASVFSVSTAVDGTITEQNVSYSQSIYTGGAEVTTVLSPHKFTISKTGYETLVLENITVDGSIDWHLELQDEVVYPAEGDVKSGVDYGDGGTEFTGSYAAVPYGDILFDVETEEIVQVLDASTAISLK